eukprot:c22581_g1_i1 orf=37-1206(+)
MSQLVKSVWASVMARLPLPPAASSSSAAGGGSKGEQESTWELLTPDVLFSIFALLPAHDLVAASLVCKVWLSLIRSCDSLWHNLLVAKAGPSWPFVLFAETSLRSLPPFKIHKGGLASLHHVYSARQQLPRSVIIDGGSGYCKYGWSDLDRPFERFPTFLAFGNIENPMYTSLMDFFSAIYERLAAKPTRQPVVISTPICHYDDTEVAVAARTNLRDVMHKALFNMGVKAVCAVDQAVLALIAAKQTSGIIVNIGFQVTSVVPIHDGKIMRSAGVEVTGQGALHLTTHLCELMQQNGISYGNITIVKALKEVWSYVTLKSLLESLALYEFSQIFVTALSRSFAMWPKIMKQSSVKIPKEPARLRETMKLNSITRDLWLVRYCFSLTLED